jgi:hypothetical protein
VRAGKAACDFTFGKTPFCGIISAFDCYKAPLIMAAGCDNYTAPLSRVNLPSCCQYGMEMLESIGWIVLGFAPTLTAMEAAWRIGKRRLALAEAGVH